MRRAAAYYRVSTLGQATIDRHSLPAQRADAQAWCASRGLHLVVEFEDHESGTHATREQYQEMIAAARRGEFEVIVVREFARFGREQWESLARFSELMGLGIELHETSTGEVSDPADEITAIKGAFKATSADKAAREIRANTKRGQLQALHGADRVVLGRAPYGYRRDGKTLVIDEAEAEVVRDIYRYYLGNMSLVQIVKRLDVDGRPTQGGGKWWPQTVRRILENPAYRGVAMWGEASREGSIPVIIPSCTWDAVRERVRRKAALPGAQTQRSPYLLSGLAKCGHCGGPLSGYTKRGVRSYRCTYHRLGRGCPEYNYHRADELEAQVLGQISGPEFEGIRQTAVDSVGRIEAQMAEAESRRAAIEARQREAIRSFMRGTHSENIYAEVERIGQEELTAVEDRLRELGDELADARKRSARAHLIPERARTLLEAVETMPRPQAKSVVQSLILRVDVYAGGIEPVVYV